MLPQDLDILNGGGALMQVHRNPGWSIKVWPPIAYGETKPEQVIQPVANQKFNPSYRQVVGERVSQAGTTAVGACRWKTLLLHLRASSTVALRQ